jgi:hypothetical protein
MPHYVLDSPLNELLPEFDFWALPARTAYALCNDPDPLDAYRKYVQDAHVPDEVKAAHLDALAQHQTHQET